MFKKKKLKLILIKSLIKSIIMNFLPKEIENLINEFSQNMNETEIRDIITEIENEISYYFCKGNKIFIIINDMSIECDYFHFTNELELLYELFSNYSSYEECNGNLKEFLEMYDADDNDNNELFTTYFNKSQLIHNELKELLVNDFGLTQTEINMVVEYFCNY